VPELKGKLLHKMRRRSKTKLKELNSEQNADWEKMIAPTKTSPQARPKTLNSELLDEEERLLSKKGGIKRFYDLKSVKTKTPHMYQNYLTYTQGYMLHDNPQSRLAIPWVSHPLTLSENFQILYDHQENERYQLRVEQAVERERLALHCEQHVARLEARAARAKHGQELPFSATSYLLLKDEHLINHYTLPSEDSLKNALKHTKFVIDCTSTQKQILQDEAAKQQKPVQPTTPPVTRRSAAAVNEKNVVPNPNELPSITGPPPTTPVPMIYNCESYDSKKIYSHLMGSQERTFEWANFDIEEYSNNQRKILIKRQKIQIDCLYQVQVYEWLIKTQEDEMNNISEKTDRKRIIAMVPNDVSEINVPRVFVPNEEDADLLP
jgi:hypothetical protein